MLHRRLLLAVIAVLLAAPAAAAASSAPSSGGGAFVDLHQAALPVVAEGRLRNYVFVAIRLQLRPGADTEAVRAREPYFRDALVRAAGRQSLAVADDWTRMDEALIARVMMAEAARIAGPGVVRRVEVTSQAPQRRTGVNPPRR